MIFAPLDGFRHVEVTDQRRSIDFAHICRDIVDVHFPDAEKILLVCDNLNTHKPGSLYKAFDTQEAERIAESLIHKKPGGSLKNLSFTIPRPDPRRASDATNVSSQGRTQCTETHACPHLAEGG